MKLTAESLSRHTRAVVLEDEQYPVVYAGLASV